MWQCSSHSVIFEDHFWTCAVMPMSLVYWIALNWTQHSMYSVANTDWKLRNHLFQPACDAVPQAAEDAPDCLFHEATLLVPIHLVHQGLYCKTACQLVSPHHIWVHGAFPSQMQNSMFPLFQLRDVCVIPFLQPVEGPLDGHMTLWCTGHSAQFVVIYQLAESGLNPTIQIVNEDVEQFWSQYSLLEYTASDWPPGGYHATGCYCWALWAWQYSCFT